MGFPEPYYRWRPHPWHGLEVGSDVPRIVHAFVEITPFDLVKYETDNVWSEVGEIGGLPEILVERLCHYFTTYKLVPGQAPSVSIEQVYAREHAESLITASVEDYQERFGSSG